MKDNIVVQEIHFSETQLQVVYLDVTEVRDIAGAPVVRTQTLVVPRGHPSFAEEIEALFDAAAELVDDVADDFFEAPPWQPENGDEDEGMGSG